jgi:ACS family glucarate transporter-like MFS transporter
MNSPSLKATRVRYSILALLCMLAMITYLDRAMYGSAKKDMMESVGKSEADFYLVLVVFQLAYALFEIPTGWMGDTFGPRKTLLRIVLWWSFFVGLTGFAGYQFGSVTLIGFGALLVMQALFGMGEAGAFPNISRALYNWFPSSERGFAQGAIWLSARFMGGLTPFIWVLLVEIGGLSWRQALWLFAGVAAFWCAVFYFYFRNKPEEHSLTNTAEQELIQRGKIKPAGHEGVPWKKIFSNRNVWALCVMYMVTNFNWYFLMYYLPKTLKSQFPDWTSTDPGKLKLALLGGAPLLIGMIGCLLGGMLSDWYIRRTSDRKWGRRIFAMLGYGLAGTFYLTATGFTHNLYIFASCLILVGFANDFMMGPSWATAQDIGQRYSAIVSGTMNMIGNLGAALGNLITGLILKSYTSEEGIVDPKGFVTCFTLYGIVYFLGVVAWLFIDASKPIEYDPEHEPDRGGFGDNGNSPSENR